MNKRNKKYRYYCIARNKAWKILIECCINHFPLNLKIISKHYNIKIVPYSKSKNYNHFTSKLQNGDGFSASVNGQKIIYFNDQKGSYERQRFTIAHELGHCLLNHDLSKTKHRNSEMDNPNDSVEEMQANVFARDILMPAFILKETNCLTPVQISTLCKVSQQAAKIREKRLKLLIEKHRFYTNPNEKKLKKQFELFIKNSKT